MRHVPRFFAFLSVVVTLLSSSATLSQAAKPQGWRGDGTGVFAGSKPPVGWSESSNIVWKVKMPGRSNSQPVIVGNRLFVCSEPNILFCLDRKTGKTLWQKSHAYRDFVEPKIWAKAEAELKITKVILE